MKNQYGSVDPSTIDPNMLAGMMGVFGIVGLALFAFFILLYWKIFSKAGYAGALSLLMLIPIANVIVMIWFAFADWPVAKKARGQAA